MSRAKSYFYLKTIEVAKTSTYHKSQRVGCIIVYKNTIISSGSNSEKTHPIQQKQNKLRIKEDNLPKLHAEIKALIPLQKYNIDYSKVELYVARINKNNELRLAYPCKSCMNYIKLLGIRHINYSILNGFEYEKL